MTSETLTTREEVFAPVVALYPFKTEGEVLERANDCDVGLGSFIITESIARMWRVAKNLEVGMVGVNLGMLSACESPFGGKSVALFYENYFTNMCLGVKESEYGREGGRDGIDEYLTVKSIIIYVT
jgi:succinate-semialdehyde dehydrogenase/glutarate-semialdehyde dehydrogenase